MEKEERKERKEIRWRKTETGDKRASDEQGPMNKGEDEDDDEDEEEGEKKGGHFGQGSSEMFKVLRAALSYEYRRNRTMIAKPSERSVSSLSFCFVYIKCSVF